LQQLFDHGFRARSEVEFFKWESGAQLSIRERLTVTGFCVKVEFAIKTRSSELRAGFGAQLRTEAEFFT